MSYYIYRLPRRLTPEEEEMSIYDIFEQLMKKARGKKAAQDGDEFDDELYDELDDEFYYELDGCEPADEPEYKPVKLCQDDDTSRLKIDEDKAADEPEYKPVKLCQDDDTSRLKIDEDFDKTSQFHFNCVAWPKLLMLAVNYGWEPLRPPDHYLGSWGQVVNGEDTKNLVTALQRTLDDLARIIPTEPSWGPLGPIKLRDAICRLANPSKWQTEQAPETSDEDSNDLDGTIMGPNWNLSPEEFWADNLETLKNFIDFALKADYGLRIA
ncbi:MAG: hypothetical protein XD68_1705 [Synergistales bacterium 54_24]|nr:MAG: hypothetical protein XD68_1705 [Synergistales bacterium 54_24]